jgi:hypothetical protein
MRCWCARCKVLVPVVHLERWVTGESGEGIVRGACAICGHATGEIGVYAAPAAERRSEHAWPERVRVAASQHGRLGAPHDTSSRGRHRHDAQTLRDGAGSGREAVRTIAAPTDDPPRPDAEHLAGEGGNISPAKVGMISVPPVSRNRALAADLDPVGLPS